MFLLDKKEVIKIENRKIQILSNNFKTKVPVK